MILNGRLLTWKTYIADISYKNFFFFIFVKKCDKIHNFMHYVQILLNKNHSLTPNALVSKGHLNDPVYDLGLEVVSEL